MKNNKTTITVITVCKNAEKYIAETIESVINQKSLNESFKLQYLIFDGNSSDKTNEIIKRYSSQFSEIEHFIENDEGLYDGLVKGFKKAKGDIVAYINAGDFYNKNAFEIVDGVFDKFKNVKWITGSKVIYNEQSEIISYLLPFKYRRRLIRVGAYGKNLPFIQQESTFWKKELLELVDFEYLKTLKKSGDMYLWYSFSKKFDLFSVETYLSGFKFHENQLTFRETGNTDPYLREASNFLEKKNILHLLLILIDGFFWFLSKYLSQIFSLFNSRNIVFNRETKEWYLEEIENQYKYVAWCCDVNKNQGEGKLGMNFLQYLSKSKNIKIKVKSLYNTIYIKEGKIFKSEKPLVAKKTNLNFFEKYINPFYGLIVLWFYFFKKKSIIYVNFLPLWNFLLFALLPPKTIYGPITGTLKVSTNFFVDRFFRKYLMPYFFNFAIKIMNLRKKPYLFATENLKDVTEKKLKTNKFYNFSFSEVSINNKNELKDFKEREIDFCIYYRKYPTKNNDFFVNMINYLSNNNMKVVVVGDKIDNKDIEFKGILSSEELNNYLSNTKYTIVSDENLFSLFTLDCIKHNLNIFYNNKNYKVNESFESLRNKMFALDYSNYDISKKEITKKFNEINSLPDYKIDNFNKFYDSYFQLLETN